VGHPDASEAEKLQDRKGNDPLTSLAFYIIQVDKGMHLVIR